MKNTSALRKQSWGVRLCRVRAGILLGLCFGLVGGLTDLHAQELAPAALRWSARNAQASAPIATSIAVTSGAEMFEHLAPEERVRLEADLAEAGLSVEEASDHLFFGVRVGLPFLAGFTLTDLRTDTNGKRTFIAEAEASTVIFLSTLNAGGGKFLGGGRNWYVGGRVHAVNITDLFGGSNKRDGFRLGLGPEAGVLGTVGKSEATLLSARLGVIATQNLNNTLIVFPEIKLGIGFRFAKFGRQ